MGIINCTPDSFFDGGMHNNVNGALRQIEKHLHAGATFIDIGGYSSRPGAEHIDDNEETARIAPIIKEAVKNFPEAIFSVDTFRSEVAKTAINSGAHMINDISAGEMDTNMLKVIIELNVPYVMMHMKNTPQNMQSDIQYENLLTDIGRYFSEKLNYLNANGVHDVLLDVGFGFAKTIKHNYELLSNLRHFDFLNSPMLVGVSRKSMLYKPLEISSKEALNATTAAHMIALQNGANILRVHDTKEAMEAVEIYNLCEQNK